MSKQFALLFGGFAGIAAVLFLGALSVKHRGAEFERQPRAVLAEAGIADSRRPAMSFSTSGVLYLLAAYAEGGHTRLGLAMSHDGGDSFSRPVAVSAANAEVSAHGENGPSLAQRGMAVYAVWQQRTADGPQRVMFARSQQMGHAFDSPVSVADKKDESFSGFSSLGVGPTGDIFAVWLDGRERAKPGTFGVYLARSNDKGATFGANVRVGQSACPCCRPSIAFGAASEVYVAWREVFDGDVRDVVVATSRDGGASFEAPVRVGNDGWVLHACPESGPVMSRLGSKLAVAWFTGAAGKQDIRLATSSDGGHSFAAPISVVDDVLDANHPTLASAEDGRVVLAFQGRRPASGQNWNPTQIFVVSIDRQGAAGKPSPVPMTGKSANYAALAAAGSGRVFAAWTQPGNGDASSVVLARGRLPE